MRNRRLVMVAAFAAVLAAREARGEPIYHIKSPSTLTTAKGSELKLPPGYFLDERTWQERDLEMRRLQEQETRLRAENRTLRVAADEIPWKTIGCAIGFGVLVGFVSFNIVQ